MEKCKNRSWTHGPPARCKDQVSSSAALLVSVSYSSLFSKPVPPDQWSHFGVSTVLSVPVSQSASQAVSQSVFKFHLVIYKREKPWITCICPITMSFCSTCSFSLLGTKCKGTLLLIKGPFCILSTKSCLIILPWCVNGTNNCCKLLKNVLYEPIFLSCFGYFLTILVSMESEEGR